MSTIGFVDPELRDALAQQLPPLTAESLTQRRANALELAGTVPKPNLPDIATEEIHVESAFGAKPIRVLTYRPVTSNDALPAIAHIHGGGFVMGAPEMKDVENRLFASELPSPRTRQGRCGSTKPPIGKRRDPTKIRITRRSHAQTPLRRCVRCLG
jgi:hypothetical protein